MIGKDVSITVRQVARLDGDSLSVVSSGIKARHIYCTMKH